MAQMGEETGVYRVLVGKSEGRRPLGKPTHSFHNLSFRSGPYIKVKFVVRFRIIPPTGQLNNAGHIFSETCSLHYSLEIKQKSTRGTELTA